MRELAAKVAVVTGGASGIGRAVVRRLLATGASVLAVDINGPALAEVAIEGAETLQADVADPDARRRILETAGETDYLVNAAGIVRVSPLADVDKRQWDEIFAVNAEAVFFLCQAFGRALRPGGAIVNVSSLGAKTSEIDMAVYSAAKCAVLSITRSFAADLAPRSIRVNAICPGIIDTPMQGQFIPYYAERVGLAPGEFQSRRIERVPLRRIGTPEDCASLVWFLLSSDSSYLTGQAINIDGGLVTW